ncbi:MAG TPA: hypothetical protein VFQ35_10845 [Polyangiaceae bacterium]|nr:hypothetical protein [Polyangiaceae bacterium]
MRNAQRCNSVLSSTHAGAALAFALVFAAGRARADVAMCVQSHADGQREAKAGHLKAAAELFATCGSTEGCPDTIRAECADLYRETQTNTPTAIFAALDANGNDLTNVKVYAGDALLLDGLNGRAVALDPGKYTFKFELPSGQTLTNETLVREGEKNRIISVRVPKSPSPSPRLDEPLRHAPNRALPAPFWVSAGVGAAALASFGVFALLGRGKQSALDDCAPRCPASRHDDFDAMRRDYLVADVSLGVGAVSLGLATWLFFSSQPSSATAATKSTHQLAGVSVAPVISTHDAGLVATAVLF